MFQKPRAYQAVYIAQETCRDVEIRGLVDWINTQKGPLVVTAGSIDQLESTPIVRELRAQGVQTVSSRQLSNYRSRLPQSACVLALWPDIATLSEIEKRIPAAVAVAPWFLQDIATWVLARRPVNLMSGEQATGPVFDPVVQIGMQTMISSSNPANGLTGYNKTQAVQVFQILRNGGYAWDATHIAGFAAAHDWDLDAAERLGALAADIREGKRRNGGTPYYRKDILEIWRKEAKQSAPHPGH